MNILFINRFKPVKHVGGIEMVTGLLAREFMRQGCRVCCLWMHQGPAEAEPYDFTDSCQLSHLSISFFASYIEKYKIDEIIVQAEHIIMKPLRCAVDMFDSKAPRVTFVLHSSPGWELLSLSSWKQFYCACLRNGFTQRKVLQLLAWPLYKFLKRIQIRELYAVSYRLCDSMMLLSKYFIPEYMAICRVNDSSKYCSLPNPCSFPEIATPSILAMKEKRVLIVSRLLETQKKYH